MARTSTARRLDEAPIAPATRLEFGGGDPPAPPVQPNAPIASNAWLATVMFLGAEAMFFAGLIGAFIVFRIGSSIWPPPFQPRLPVGITGVNTIVLLASAVTMHMALRSVRAGAMRRLNRMLAMTAALGGVFLLIQGYEWARLIHFGLTVSSSIYGGAILYFDRISRIPCGRRAGLVDFGVCASQPGLLLTTKVHRRASLRHVLDVCCRPVADSLWFGVSVLTGLLTAKR